MVECMPMGDEARQQSLVVSECGLAGDRLRVGAEPAGSSGRTTRVCLGALVRVVSTRAWAAVAEGRSPRQAVMPSVIQLELPGTVRRVG